MKIGKAAALAACTAASLVLTACGSDSGSGDSGSGDVEKVSGESVKVVATTTQICDYVTQIATDESDDAELSFNKTGSDGNTTHFGADPDKAKSELDLTCILAPNASAHDHEMTPQQMKAMTEANLLMVNGVDLEHFLDNAVTSSGFGGTLVVTSGFLTSDEKSDEKAVLEAEKNLPYKVYRGVEQVDINEWPFATAAGEEPEFIFDPHVWTSPHNAMVQVKNIGAALEEASPENADLFKEHVSRFEEELDELDKWAAESFASVPDGDRVLFTSHDAFGYLSKEFDINFIGTALTDFNDQADATAEHIASEADKVRESGAKALFAENSNNSKSIEAIASAAGVKAVIGDDALYGDSLGPVGTDGETYIGAIMHNVTNLVRAWGGTVAPVPEILEPYTPKDL
ncbi:metal ABC transporter substrate-binding protein [Corynebacterium pygosceleis]|uniref:Metal ABC transporter substrate-binding protein n=1 Tax=Corynebacterium pygosceleis TaxID=2800406 RepID=A0A9Q4C7D3_9CORY|nr:metal ABC transporter substrate-binding protein [Corynebacterium pygosceleis]MCK7637609.1 metal ABC transporter substrate-binding protein [Corynebacterium pygosceleis]MCK7674800.1 metal ABC transporter substrate-binding protein [Corynebacterium pygosceleis]MCL0119611.1 metal ABC transporter substrate-binding protein [Corynebacterium pygosceleis]MCX7444852.1 metal ABC transporter substrate-binding protein [Corynebacterium pygosceleis]MCX7468062.1 metal ABC transporter substrate-binding prote